MKNNIILSLSNLFVTVFDSSVVQGISVDFSAGAVYAIMGPNGSGKSSLAYALMGHPDYIVTQGIIALNGNTITTVVAHERARQGIFLAFQHPCEIPGVSVLSFLKEAYCAVKKVHISVVDFKALLLSRCEQLGIDSAFIERGLNEGFSGGEKKRLELLQLLLLQPSIAILDEIDSGLDVDALKVVADGIALARQENPLMTLVLITHYQRILRLVVPDYVYVMYQGQLVMSGDATLAEQVEHQGYEAFRYD